MRRCLVPYPILVRSLIFENLLAHDYGAVDDDAVFGLVYSDLIVLKGEVRELLDEYHDAN